MKDELGGLLSDYLALDEARVFRRLFVTRCGTIAVVAAVIGLFVPALPTTARWFPAALFLVPPVWSCVAVFRLERRLSSRLGGASREKVIKSS